jgi:hypothetical protein
MSWIPPQYLESLVRRTNQIRYIWNEADLLQVYSLPEGLDVKGLPWAGWVDAAICGFTIATLEWPIFRLTLLDPDQTSRDAVEAAWCANIDRRYAEGLEFSRREWTGPIRSPLLTCLNIMHEALFECLEAGARPLHCPVIACGLVEHLCAESQSAFLAWREQIIDRLDHFYQAPDPLVDLYGQAASKMIVAPQIFDPVLNFDIGQAPQLADDFLRNVDYRSNPLLMSPQQMKQEGFEGVPYRYS